MSEVYFRESFIGGSMLLGKSQILSAIESFRSIYRVGNFILMTNDELLDIQKVLNL